MLSSRPHLLRLSLRTLRSGLSARVLRPLCSATSAATSPPAAASANPPAEAILGSIQRMEFQAETRKLLDIVANSLYTDKEVFLREIVSNASDALEKRRYAEAVGQSEKDTGEMAIAIETDAAAGTLTIADTGIGMSKEELVANLGTIASSGSKRFVQQLQTSGGDGASAASANVIGQFGVGFYSVFMVADEVTVYSRKHGADVGHCWKSTGDGSYELSEAANVAAGTKVSRVHQSARACWSAGRSPVWKPPIRLSGYSRSARAQLWARWAFAMRVHALPMLDTICSVRPQRQIILKLKEEEKRFASRFAVESNLRKYSSFVGFPVTVDGERANTIAAVWAKSKNEVSQEEHNDFYRFIAQVGAPMSARRGGGGSIWLM